MGEQAITFGGQPGRQIGWAASAVDEHRDRRDVSGCVVHCSTPQMVTFAK